MVRPAVLTVLLLAASVASAADLAPNGDEFFEKEVRPLLVERCLKCHDDAKAKGDLKLTSRGRLLKGGDRGPAVTPGKPDDSLLIQAVRYDDKPKMPPDGKLGDADIGVLSRWVEIGAPWPKATVLAAPAGEFRITDEQRRVLVVPAGQGDGTAGRQGRRVERLAHRPLRPGQARGDGTFAGRVGRQARADSPRDVRPDGPAAGAGGDRRLPGGRFAAGVREGGGPAAGVAGLRRTLGPLLAGRGPLRRHGRRDRRLPGAAGLPLPQLRHRLL